MLKIYNTLKREKVVFKSIKPQVVSLYICGVTVYDYCHLGHARTYSSADVMVRYFNYLGYDVNYVRNITDIDDKIIKRAAENKISCEEVTSRFIMAMHEDFSALKFLPPTHEPRATQFVSQMIKLIATLITNEAAYIGANGDVYFSVRSQKNYGKLSNHSLEHLESGVRVEVSEAKRDPLDFVLWKLAKPNEPTWDSPWGRGRPGWHTECVAMASDLLGANFDIHGGGRDLIFPHHENEIAQAEALPEAFANTWVHGGFLQINEEKMSKSLNNFLTIRDLLAIHQPEILRYFLIASHYRSPLVYSEENLLQSKAALTRLYTALRNCEPVDPVENSAFEIAFKTAMDDDFNTPIALSQLFNLAHEVWRLLPHDQALAYAHASLLRKLGGLLGILQENPELFLQSDNHLNMDKINELIKKRETARAEKNWQLADEIRQELTAMSIIIEDSNKGTTWRKA